MKLSLPLLLCTLPPVLADTSFDHSEKFAWSANTGWISFRHDRPSSPAGVVLGGAFLSGYAWSANTGWIHFGDGMPANGYAYSNAGSDHGVNHDGAGNLSGYAWSANTGWIHFGWASTSDPNRPQVNLTNGAMGGYAWSANTGWINLGTGKLTAQTMKDDDTDGDGMPDWWEVLHFNNLAESDGITDSDGDGASDLAEYAADTDPESSVSHLKIVHHIHHPDLAESRLTFTTTPTRLYRIEYSDTPALSWTDSTLGTFAPSEGGTSIRIIHYPGNAQKFFRVLAVVPLTP